MAHLQCPVSDLVSEVLSCSLLTGIPPGSSSLSVVVGFAGWWGKCMGGFGVQSLAGNLSSVQPNGSDFNRSESMIFEKTDWSETQSQILNSSENLFVIHNFQK